MNSINKTPFKRRSDPFSSNIVESNTSNNESKTEIQKEIESPIKNEPIIEEAKQVTIEKKTPVVEKPKTIISKPVTKKVIVPDIDDADREKYTATMDRALRIRVKKAAIDLGLQVSSFIEVACLEKLEREGK